MEKNLPLYTIAVNNYEYLQGVYVSYERALEDACQMAREDMILNDDDFEREWGEYVQEYNVSTDDNRVLYRELLNFIDPDGYYHVMTIYTNE